MFGMWLALDAPARVRALVTIGTPAVALGARLDSLRMLDFPESVRSCCRCQSPRPDGTGALW